MAEEETKEPQDPVADIYIGTAGYNYAEWRNDVFYPKSVKQADELRHYSGIFNAVEINASFHAVPRLETLQQWDQKAKQGFVFSFKVPQEITHTQRLVHIDDALRYFLNRLIEGLGDKHRLGPILFQLPPSLSKNIESLHRIGRILEESNNLLLSDTLIMVAFEFRNKSWYCEEVYNVMRQYKFGLCENISPDKSTHHVSDQTPAGVWHYIRFHKNADHGVTFYTEQELESFAHKLVWRRRHGIVQYCYFMNEHEGNGPKNAKTLIKFIQEQCPGRLVQEGWKPDAKAATIQSMFAKASSNNTPIQSTRTPSGASTAPKSSTLTSKKRPVAGIQAYFTPTTATSKGSPITTSSSAKRLKQSTSSAVKKSPNKKETTRTLESFFQKTSSTNNSQKPSNPSG